MIDVPLSVSPIVVGLALLLVYSGRYRLARAASLEAAGLQIIYAPPGHHHGDRVRQPAAGDPRARSGAARDRHRPGAGGPQSRRIGRCRPSCGSRCRRSSGPCSTASCSAWPGRSASSVRSRSSPAASPCAPRPPPCWWRSATSSSGREHDHRLHGGLHPGPDRRHRAGGRDQPAPRQEELHDEHQDHRRRQEVRRLRRAGRHQPRHPQPAS